MLTGIKTILKNVIFDQELFRKELRKALDRAEKEDTLELYTWCTG
jgi:hypothetical protein